jgi:hypothetical protein
MVCLLIGLVGCTLLRMRTHRRTPRYLAFRRIDVVISSSHVSRVMRPFTLLELHTSDSIIYNFDASLDNFQRLRYNVAKALSELVRVDSHPALRIT